jgi:hypothetical protein
MQPLNSLRWIHSTLKNKMQVKLSYILDNSVLSHSKNAHSDYFTINFSSTEGVPPLALTFNLCGNVNNALLKRGVL